MQTCFIAMPITTPDPTQYGGDADHFKHVLEHLFVPAVRAAGLDPLPPIAQGSDLIHAEIIAQLESSDLVLCDVSTLNANVFFELGIRTARNRPISLVKDDLTPRIPFDTTLLNHHTYRSGLMPWHLQSEIDALATHVKVSLERSAGTNGLWKHFGLSLPGAAAEDTSDVGTKLTLLAQQVQVLSHRLASLPADPLAAYGIAETDSDRASRLIRHLQELLKGYGIRSNGAQWGAGAMRLKTDEMPSPEVAERLSQIARALGYALSFNVVPDDGRKDRLLESSGDA